MNNVIPINFWKRRTPSSLLGLSLEGSHLEGVVLRRANGSLQPGQRFAFTLSLDPLTNDVELVGREILNHLEGAGVRERHCVVAVPLKWALAAHTKVPELPEADVASFLQIEAERGFPTDVTTLQVSTSRLASASGEQHATFVGVPKNHVERLEQVLRAARLKPLSFSLGITALQPPEARDTEGVLALTVGQNQVGLQITCGGGVAALRALEGTVGTPGGDRVLSGDLIAREARITLGQLPADLRGAVRRIRLFGPRETTQPLADEIRSRFETGGMRVELATSYVAGEFGRTIPLDTAVSSAFSLAAWQLAGRKGPFEFLPPKISALQQLTAKYASGKWRTAGLAAAVVVLLAGAGFGWQQWQLNRLRSKWLQMSPQVKELGGVQDQIVKYRPWFDDSLRYLGILKDLTLSFPADGTVTAKTLVIREVADAPSTNVVSCTGNAQNYAALMRTVNQLHTLTGAPDIVVPVRGKSPIQFSFDFRLNRGGIQ